MTVRRPHAAEPPHPAWQSRMGVTLAMAIASNQACPAIKSHGERSDNNHIADADDRLRKLSTSSRHPMPIAAAGRAVAPIQPGYRQYCERCHAATIPHRPPADARERRFPNTTSQHLRRPNAGGQYPVQNHDASETLRQDGNRHRPDPPTEPVGSACRWRPRGRLLQGSSASESRKRDDKAGIGITFVSSYLHFII